MDGTLCLERETKFGGGVEPADRDEAADPASFPCDPDAGRDEGEAVRYLHRRPLVRETASFQIAGCQRCFDQEPQGAHSVAKGFFQGDIRQYLLLQR